VVSTLTAAPVRGNWTASLSISRLDTRTVAVFLLLHVSSDVTWKRGLRDFNV